MTKQLRKLVKLLSLAALIICCPLILWAQTTVLKGVIKDQDGKPVSGASIVVKGLQTGVSTAEDGSFTITLPSPDATIEVSSVGYKSKSVKVEGVTTISITMEESKSQLGDVVVIGYGTQKKSNLTGAISSVNNKDFKDQPVVNLAQSIQGKVSGMNVTTPSGTPGAGLLVSIRGAQNPLYVVDGIPMLSESNSSLSTSFDTNGDQVGNGQNLSSIADINPDDIESIEILKDAASAAIYGARAANGVVLITTKKGKSGKTQVNFNTYMGFQKVARKIDFMNSDQFVELVEEARANDLARYQADPTIFGPDFDPSVLTEPLNYAAGPGAQNTVWLDEVMRTAPMSNYELSLKGGNEKTRFYLSGGYFNQEGIVIENYYKRMNARLNLDHSITDKFLVGTNIAVSRTNNRRSFNDNTYTGIITNAIGASPLMPVYDENGNYARFEDYQANWLSDNPVKSAKEIRGFTTTNRFLGTIYGEYKINPYLRFKTSWSADFTDLGDELFLSALTTDAEAVGGKAFNANFRNMTWLNENTFNYQRAFGDHNLGALVGFTQQESNSERASIAGQGFPLGSGLTNISSAAVITGAAQTKSSWRLMSYLGRVNYDFDGRFLASFTFRADGSSRFAEGNRYGFFPSGSVGWNLDREGFMANSKVFTALKLRASYGYTGDQEIGDFQNISFWQPGRYDGTSGLRPRNIADPNLTWQKNRSFNIGTDFEMWGGVISGSLEYFVADRTDLLSNIPIAGTTGFATLTTNGGEVQDKGWEFNVTSKNIWKKNFRWTTNFNISYQKNTIKKLPVDGELLSAYNDLAPTHIMKIGEAVGTFWGVKYLGVDEQTGDAQFEDINKDGVIDFNDAQIIGKARPDFYGGLTNNLRFGNWDFMLACTFSIGNDVYNLIRPVYENLGYSNDGGLDQVFANNSTNVLKRWRQPGDRTDVPRASFVEKNYFENSSMYLEDASFFRFRTLNLGYTFNRSNKKFISSLRLYGQVQNLAVITNYKGFDPEVSSTGGNNDRTAGVDYAAYPQPRVITFGLNVGF
ncbi:TonB-dependent receptor [Flavihumibacter rivuli]|uniref:SusC/RagA family TonB-linked outer membrane protein n=1 Tax=Flavihumibacter rivuli TaxID=2838156 RepID=UPI001BDF1780|nr:TonB-dependent receptor [Flavihumibacter rivuli]ULQ55383.1 TonB-dependent receptor [Flavihumibacter rivuli]